MIKVIINYQDEQIISFSAEGHAGLGSRGSDIFCAGVSAVCQTALLGLLEFLEPKPKYDIASGYLKCELPQPLKTEEAVKAQLILDTMKIGLLAMQNEYGDHISITLRR
ncbi:MAG: ribosomal-processing cysteine protease Prp [Syntrophomonadaceae bacterium]|jgi:uncharacterized protein YsxB (DUF464 family)|nr:ribosomal-processing cysteine protease Prp [Syntrophomonadaceae bacterium]